MPNILPQNFAKFKQNVYKKVDLWNNMNSFKIKEKRKISQVGASELLIEKINLAITNREEKEKVAQKVLEKVQNGDIISAGSRKYSVACDWTNCTKGKARRNSHPNDTNFVWGWNAGWSLICIL